MKLVDLFILVPVLLSSATLANATTASEPEAIEPQKLAAAETTRVRQIELPIEDAILRTSELPGYTLAMQKCLICHSADYISFQPPARTLAQWTGEVRKMHDTYGAPISETDIGSIGAYLAVTYGSAKASDADVVAASVAPETSTLQPETDVQSLLANNACLGCHAIDHKIVGPAFRDVANRYRADPSANSKLATSILEGGVNSWGDIPMPPMSSLSAKQANLIAEYILLQ